MANRYKQKITDSIKNAEEAVEDATERSGDSFTHRLQRMFQRRRRNAFEKHPVFFSILGLIGATATGKGLWGLIEQVYYFREYPEILLFFGILILLLTGQLYRDMGDK